MLRSGLDSIPVIKLRNVLPVSGGDCYIVRIFAHSQNRERTR